MGANTSNYFNTENECYDFLGQSKCLHTYTKLWIRLSTDNKIQLVTGKYICIITINHAHFFFYKNGPSKILQIMNTFRKITG